MDMISHQYCLWITVDAIQQELCATVSLPFQFQCQVAVVLVPHSEGGLMVVLQKQLREANSNKANERTLSLVKSSLDILVAAGLLQLAPRTLTPRRTGALGLITSLITLYQVNLHTQKHLAIFLHSGSHPPLFSWEQQRACCRAVSHLAEPGVDLGFDSKFLLVQLLPAAQAPTKVKAA